MQKNFHKYLIESQLTYEQYCFILDEEWFLSEGFLDTLKNVASGIKTFFKELGKYFEQISRDFNLSIEEIVKAFKNRNVFEIFRAFKFSFKKILRAINDLTTLVRKGLFKIFEEISKTGIVKKLQSGAMKVDEVLNKYPILKKLTGFIIAGLLFYMWLNMTFIGDLDYDFNISDMTNALSGNYAIADLFTSPSGLMLIALFATGSLFGLSVPWLGKTAYNLTMAIAYTLYSHVKTIDSKTILQKLKLKMNT